MYYPDDVIEEVRSRSDIVAVVGARVKLTKRGGNYFGCCPFHNEKTPSFSVSPSKQIYYCFGCGAGGSVINFLMAYENYSFPEALERLAKQAGVTLPERERTAEEKKQADLRSRLLAMNGEAAKFYYYLLRQPAGQAGQEYLTRRGLSPETQKKFGLGYASDAYNALYRYLKEKGYSDAELSTGGLIKIREKGPIDLFRSRVMFPIMDKNSRVIGFGGRVLGAGEPKYLNSPETPLFDKSRNLYGLHLARATRRPYFLLCEGYMDVIALHQAGFDCAVASLGTSLTSGHALLISRYTKKVILTYDSDGAGVKAAMRAIPLLREAGIEPRLLNMEPYKDPDEFIVHEGAEAYEKRIAEAANFFLYESDVWKKEYHLSDPTERTAYHKKLAEELSYFPDALERENYLTAVCAHQNISAELLREMMNRIGNQRLGQEKAPNAESIPEEEFSEARLQLKAPRAQDGGLLASQQILLSWAVTGDCPPERLVQLLEPEDFSEPVYREMYESLLTLRRHGEKPVPAALTNRFLEHEEQARLSAAVFTRSLSDSLPPDERSRVLTDNLQRLRKDRLQKELKNCTDKTRLQLLILELKKAGQVRIRPEDV